jgi:hypothetical protein
MTALEQGIGDLVLHFRFIGVPRGDFFFHLPLVRSVIPSQVGRIEDNGDAHDA